MRKKLLVAALKGLLAAVETSAVVKGLGTFVAELGGKVGDLPDEQRKALAGATAEDLQDALTQLQLAGQNAALAAAGVTRVEEQVAALRDAIQGYIHGYIVRIEEARQRLQEQLDKEKERGQRLVGEVSVAAWWAGALVERSPGIRELAEALKDAVKRFESEVPTEAWSETDDLRIRLAKATVANAEARYTDTLALVTEKDAKAEREATEAQINREVQVNQVRGDALYGLHEWKEALACYKRIIELRPERWATRNALANTLWSLGRLPEALAHYNAIVGHDRRLVEQQGRGELANDLARSLNNRGNALANLGRLAEALGDYGRAIETYTRLVEQEGRGELANDLASSLNNRGNAQADLGRLAEALGDYGRAIEIRARLVKEEGRAELANDLASSLNNRGIALRNLGRLDEALEDCAWAIEICARLVEEEGRAELANDLASSFNNRGNTLRDLGRLAETLGDYGRAIEICARLVEEEERAELANDLAAILNNRGIALADLGRLAEATADLDKAVAILTRLVEEEGRAELAGQLGKTIDLRELVQEKRRKVETSKRRNGGTSE